MLAALCVSIATVTLGQTATLNHVDTLTRDLRFPGRVAAVDGGALYVADQVAGTIVEYDATGTWIATHSISEGPIGIAATSGGDIFISRLDGVVGKYDASFLFQGALDPTPMTMNGPNGMAVDEAAGELYVVDGKENQVLVFDTGTLALVRAWGMQGSGMGEFQSPQSVALDPVLGHVIVADTDNSRLQVFDKNGIYLFKIGYRILYVGSSELAWFPRSEGVAVDACGNIYVADAVMGTIRAFDAVGHELDPGFVPLVHYGPNPANVRVPVDVAIAGTSLYVSSYYNATIEVFDLTCTAPALPMIAPLPNLAGTEGDSASTRKSRNVAHHKYPDNPFDIVTAMHAGTYDVALDVNGDRKVDVDDLDLTVAHFGGADTADFLPGVTADSYAFTLQAPHMIADLPNLCGRCHALDGLPDGMLSWAGQENLCVSCHASGAIGMNDPIPGRNSGNVHPIGVPADAGASLGPDGAGPADLDLHLDNGNIRCGTCHDPHTQDAGAPYLRTGNETGGLCKECHRGAAAPAAHGTQHVEYCTDCHDVHATDGANLHLIKRSFINFPTFQPVDVVFSDESVGVGPGAFVDLTPGVQGLCESCHDNYEFSFEGNPPVMGNTGLAILHTDNMPACTNCHAHDKGFVLEPGEAHADLARYDGPATCLKCHPQAATHLAASTHYTFTSDLPANYLFNPDGTPTSALKSGKGWKLCAFPSAVPANNWLGNLRDDLATPFIDKPGGCGKCHIGIGMQPFSLSGAAAPTPEEMAMNFDCLMCHAPNYSRKYYQATDGGVPQPQIFVAPRTDGVFDFSMYLDDAREVGPTTSGACLRCHINAGGGSMVIDGIRQGFKRGLRYQPDTDVHANAGLTCSDCHDAGNHKVRRAASTDLFAYDQFEPEEGCIRCHTSAPHETQTYNDHTASIACVTCHATSTGGVMFKDFGQAICPAGDGNCGPETLNTWGFFQEKFPQNFQITYKWWNGTVESPIIPRGSHGDGKLFPFKVATFNLAFSDDGQQVPLKLGAFFKSGDIATAVSLGIAAYDTWYAGLPDPTLFTLPLPTTSGPAEYHFETHDDCNFNISHDITKDHALTCLDCHSSTNPVLDWAALGIPDPVTNMVHAIPYDPGTGNYFLNGETITQDDVDRDLVGSLCSKCHADAVGELKDSVHFKVASRTDRIMFPGGGAHGMLDRACGLPATTGLTNYNSDVNLGECAKCHVGRYMPLMEGFFASSFSQMGVADPAGQAEQLVNAGLDCLICHAEQYRSYPTGTLAELAGYAPPDAASPTPTGFARVARDNGDFNHDGTPDLVIDMDGDGVFDAPLMFDSDGDGMPDTPWNTVAQDRSALAIGSIGATTEHTCLRCHEHARTGYKRGTLFRDGYDVHATVTTGEFSGANDQCTTCHTATNHKFVRGHLVGGDLGAADYPPPPPGVGPDPNDPTDLTCETCHDPSTLPAPIHMTGHLEAIACETCHIPSSTGITYSLFGQGGQLSFGRNADGHDTLLVSADHYVAGTSADVDADYDAYRTQPVFMWFNGGTSFLAQSLAVRGMPNARITPFKPMGNGMVFDSRFFDGLMATNDVGAPYNAHSMYRFFANGNNAEVFSALDMLDMTPAEVRSVTLADFQNPDPDWQTMALMQIFPNLVYFDKAAFGYEHYMIGRGSPWDGNGDGFLDSGQPFFFDMFSAANAGLVQFMGFNGPMGFPPTYEWYPPFTDVSQVISMKLPDGSLMKMFLQMQAANLPPEQQPAFLAAVDNYPAFSNGITLGGHGVTPKEQALGAGPNGCLECHGAGGALAHLVPVTQKVPTDLGPMGTLEMPVYRWKYYNVHDLVDLGLNTQNEDVVAGLVSVDIDGDTAFLRESTTTFVLNWFGPADPSGYRPADDSSALAGTGLTTHDLTWSGGEWMPVLEPVVDYVPNYAVLGYDESELIWP